jgi:hypothetical protein
LFLASQASDVGSIPIARSRNPIDSNTLTGLHPLKIARKNHEVGRKWTQPCLQNGAVGREISPGLTSLVIASIKS